MEVNYDIMRLALRGCLAGMTGLIWNTEVREVEQRGLRQFVVTCHAWLPFQGAPEFGYVLNMDKAHFWNFEEPLKIIDYWAEEIVSMFERDRRPVPTRSVVPPIVLNDQIALILEWQEFIRKELENQTGQKWAVAHDFEERSGDIRFICYWQGRNLAMPPLSFHRLASNDNAEVELKERAKQVAEARALL